MTKEDARLAVMGAISMALKDPTLQHGFEIICKNLADLEKENVELKCECRRCVYSDCPCVLSDYKKDKNGICDHFKDVFDENVELKDDNKVMADNYSKMEQKFYDNLTKAKEHIKRLIEAIHIWDCDNLAKTEIEAEQFLSEVEK